MPLKAPKDKHQFDRLVKVMAQLRSKQGCPWDRKQTHVSLKPYLIEEAYEVFEAIDSKDPQKLKAELGDLLLQAVFHAQLAAERKNFTIYDVAEAISTKLVVRHPHVYAKASKVRSAEDQVRKWEDIKLKEKEHAARKSIVDGVPKAMPALSRASRVLGKAGKAKFQWTSRKQAWAKFDEELGEFRRAVRFESMGAREEELGDLLMALVNVARYEKLDPEHALHQGVRKLSRRIQGVEEGARRQGKEIGRLRLSEILELWNGVKRAEKRKA
jgi:tetrapyrrole methylase family protein/MazG family protein